MRDIVFVNDKYVPREEAMVPVEDRGYQFADGVYEVVRFHGRRGLRLVAHLQRMQESSDALRIQGGPTVAEWHEILDRLIAECQIPDDENHVMSLYQQVSRGENPRNHVFPKVEVKPTVVAYFRMAPKYTAEQRADGIALSSQKDERWERCFIKSICLLPVVMAKQAAVEAGAMEALLVRNNIVTEGGATNAYCVRDGVVCTHPVGPHILKGITRTMVLEAAERAGVTVREEAVSLDQFRTADEAFISSTTMDIMPATKLDGQPIGNGKVGPVTAKLAAALNDLVMQEIRAEVASAR